MRVDVLCFGVLKEFLADRQTVELRDGAPVGELVAQLRGTGQAAEGIWASLAIAVNREYAGSATVLYEGDEVALLPPVSGGCQCV